jgi:hypothetical protein
MARLGQERGFHEHSSNTSIPTMRLRCGQLFRSLNRVVGIETQDFGYGRK